MKIADLVEHAQARRLFPALVTAAEDVGTPQIRNATGVTLRSIPITPDKLLTELERAGGTN